MTMRLVTPILLATTVLSAIAESRPMDNYRSIIDRNPFGLQPVKTFIQPPVTNAPPPPKKIDFYLTGISSIGFPRNPKTVYLVNKDNSKKDFKEKFYKLRLNEPQGDVSLEDIDEKNRRVKIKANGDEQWLSMKENSIPSGAGAPPPAMGVAQPGFIPGQSPSPGAVPIPLPGGGAMPIPNMPVAQPNFQTPAPSNPARRIPRSNNGAFNGASTPMGAPVNQTIAAAQAAYAGQAPSYGTPSTPGYGQPSVTFGNGSANMNPGQNAAPPAPVQESQLDPAAAYVDLKVWEEKNRKEGRIMPPIPNL